MENSETHQQVEVKPRVLTQMLTYWKVGWMRIRGSVLKLFLKMLGCKVGGNFRCAGWPNFKVYPSGNINIGNHVTIGKQFTLEITPSGYLDIGDHAHFADRVILSSIDLVYIGAYVGIADDTSIRGSFHLLSKETPIAISPSYGKPVRIEKNTSVGAHCTILPGVIIPEGVFIGANSVVTAKSQLQANAVYAGNPVKFVRPIK